MTGLKMKYFVLNPYKKNAYGEASRDALRAYVKSILRSNSKLAEDLLAWLLDIEETLQKGKKNGKK